MTENNQTTSQQATARAGDTLAAFVFEKTQKTNDILIEAQRLINLYRQLDAFGADFVPVFDKMLLSATPEVQLALSGLSSGDVVRQYLKFLQSRLSGQTDSDETESHAISEDAASFLPSPDDIPPFQMAPTVVSGDGTTVSPDMTGALVQMLAETQKKTLEQQGQFLKQALEQFQQAAGRDEGARASAGFDMTAFQQAQQKMMMETVERLSTQQAQLFSKALAEVTQNSQKMAQEQMQNIGTMLAHNGIGVSYPHVEEYVEPVAVEETPRTAESAQEETVKQPVLAPDIPDDIEILSEMDLPTDHL